MLRRTRILGIVVAVACSVSGTADATTNLKPFDPVALQGVVEATAKELLLPGTMVLLRTPQGDFTFGYGATELGRHDPAARRHAFQDRLEHQDNDSCHYRAAGPGMKTAFRRSGLENVEGVPNGDDITISELLKMRSGLYNHTSAPELTGSLDNDPTRAWTPEELLAIAFKHPSLGQKYGYGITEITFGPNNVYFHGGEMPGYNSFMGYDPVNDVTLIIWTSLTISLDGKTTANTIMQKMLDQIYTVSPLQ